MSGCRRAARTGPERGWSAGTALGLGSRASSRAGCGGESGPRTGRPRLGEAAGQLLSPRGARHGPDGLLTPGRGCVEWNKSAVYVSLRSLLWCFGAAGPVRSPQGERRQHCNPAPVWGKPGPAAPRDCRSPVCGIRAGQSGAERGRPHPGAVPGARERSRKRESAVVAAAGPVGWERGRGAGAMGCPGPTGRAPGLLLLLLLAAGGRGAPRDTVICSQVCRRGGGSGAAGPGRVLTSPARRASPAACSVSARAAAPLPGGGDRR